MARQPEVFVRELTPDEAQRLIKITRTVRDRGSAASGGDRARVDAGPRRDRGRDDVRGEAAVRAGDDPRVQRRGQRQGVRRAGVEWNGAVQLDSTPQVRELV